MRGTPLNTGDLLTAALAAGAAPYGDWSSCHSVAWDAWHPANEGNRELTNQLTRSGYPLGIVVNARGERFLDEGADFRNYTYAKYGARILAQPGGVAFQLFDATTRPLLRSEEYDMPGASVVEAATLDELAAGIGVDPAALARTVEEFNAGIDRAVPFDLAVKDGRAARVEPPKSQLGDPAGDRAVLRLPRHLRDHVHLRRPARRHRRPRARRRRRADPGAVRVRGDARRAVQRQLPGRDGADVGRGVRPARGVAGLSPAVTRRATGCRRRSGWLRRRRRRS